MLPDYRLTCFFVDKNYRRKGMAGYVRHQGKHHCVMRIVIP
jgi:hypothetical protein